MSKHAIANAARHPVRPEDHRALRAIRHTLRVTAIALTLLIASPLSHAETDDARRQFEAGRVAFEAQRHAEALERFEAALASGLSGPAVHFNIGVCAYRIGDYERAKRAFAAAARSEPMAALAHYNIGLVALAEGDDAAAVRWFSLTEREATDERLHDLAVRQLADLNTEVGERRWSGYAAVGAGYDDNVALVSDAEVLGVSGSEDGFVEMQLAVSAPAGDQWRFDIGLLSVDYLELDSFDQLAIYGGGRYRLRLGRWTNDFGLQLAYSTLDQEGFENKQTLALQTSTALGSLWHARLRYRGSTVEGLSDFDELSGSRHEASVRLHRHRETWDFGVEYQFDVNDYQDENLSTRRHQVGFDIERELRNAWVAGLEAIWRHSRYEVSSNGTEDRSELALWVARSLSERWRLVGRYAYAYNDADVAELNYERSRVSLGVEALL